MLKPICYACAADLCLCGLAVVAGEAHEFGRPSQLLCLATVVDIEDAAERVDQRFAFSALPMSGGAPPVCNIANRVTLFVVHDGKVPEQMW